MVKIVLDVCYDADGAGTGGWVSAVAFGDFLDEAPLSSWTKRVENVEPYESGQFHKRELPCLIMALADAPEPFDMVVVDAHVYLDDEGEPGLGRRLWEDLQAKGIDAAVIGVAKKGFHGLGDSSRAFRPGSERYLTVTSVGMVQSEAVRLVESMHGNHRIPTMLRLADALCRGAGVAHAGLATMPISSGPALK